PVSHHHFGRRISDGCVTCHAGRANRDVAKANQFGTPVFHELSLGCERCHGPGKQHIAFHSEAGGSPAADPIVNPADLDHARQLSVCYQCHLHGADRVARSGRSEYDFRPGERLSDVWVSFVNGAGINSDATTDAVSQVEQMHASRCYQRSEGRMTCTSCHDPHRIPSATERTEFYRSRCLSCHAEQDAGCALPETQRLEQNPQDSCVACHMPARDAADVPHTSQTDHRIIRSQSLLQPSAADQEVVLIDPELFPVPEIEQRRARGILLARRAESGSDSAAATEAIRLLQSVLSDGAGDVRVLDALAACYDLSGDASRARSYLLQALSVSPDDEWVLRGLAANCLQSGDHTDALKYLTQLLKDHPDDGRLLFQKTLALSRLNREAEAFETCLNALEVYPHEPGIRVTLIQLARQLGREDVADRQQRDLDRMNEVFRQFLQRSDTSEHRE
ncbi:MAG: tetratricopeptide repeat protein, partial [Planctomycetaceae bacterium]|nr:tetratricopeptide repeat protein [Planctomycetaceae bacterium]